MSTVWIVPFLMFFEVTTMVAAVAVVPAMTAETTAATSALFRCSPFLGLLPTAADGGEYERFVPLIGPVRAECPGRA
jgi:hypothetical protein